MVLLNIGLALIVILALTGEIYLKLRSTSVFLTAIRLLTKLNASAYVFVSFAEAVKLAMYWDDLVITPCVTYVTICNLVVLVNDILSLIRSGNVKYVLLSEYISICNQVNKIRQWACATMVSETERH